jgi:hypothetical protein
MVARGAIATSSASSRPAHTKCILIWRVVGVLIPRVAQHSGLDRTAEAARDGQVSTDAVSRMRRCAVPSFTARDLDELCCSPHHEQVILAGAGLRLTHHE